MTIGVILISVAFIASVVATTAYSLYYKERQENLLNLANISFVIMSMGIALSLALLIYLIQIHDFRFDYVYSYSSRILNKFYLFSTLWAGQQGTFLMWLFYTSIFGFILIKTTARKNPLVMVFLVLVQCFLLLILLKKSPFSMIWHIHEEVPIGFMPQDGAGLNPLLQNPWMVIHPPTLFVGYSSTVVPFVFAMAAMVTRDYQGWIKAARPWLIFNVMILGTGIIMGGYWAYTTLGWGGYWGWDPVENASLVPWIFGLILMHGMLIQGKRKALVRTNFLWAGLIFLTMLWGSYLTRSGVLTDFSVHSFAPSGLSLYMIIFQILFTGIFVAALISFLNYYHKSGEKPVAFGDGLFNRETFIFFGMATLILVGLFVLLGTSAPLYTQWFSTPASLSPDFYNTMIIPLAVFMFIAVGIAPLLAWKTSEFRNVKTALISAAGALVLTLLAVAGGLGPMESIGENTPYFVAEGTATPEFVSSVRDTLFNSTLKYSPYFLFFLAAFVIIINGKTAYTFVKNNYTKAGGYIAHVGLGFMLIGVITSSIYDTSEKVMLPRGEFHQTEFGYDIKFVNFVDMPDGRDRVKLIVKTQHGSEYEAFPQFYYSDYSKAYMISPDVKVQFAKDIYISPISFTPAQFANQKEIKLGKKQSQSVDNLKITFNKFDVQMGGNSQIVTADLTVEVTEAGYPKAYNVLPVLKAENGQMQSTEVAVPNSAYKIKIASVNASSGEVQLAVMAPGGDEKEAKDMLAIEVSEKPFISILWFGTIIFIFGSFISMVNRVQNISNKRRK